MPTDRARVAPADEGQQQPQDREITFAGLVEYGRQHGANIVNGMPWSFSFNGVPITHENDECYLVNTRAGTQRFTPRDSLLVGLPGQLLVMCPSTDSLDRDRLNWMQEHAASATAVMDMDPEAEVGYRVDAYDGPSGEGATLRDAIDAAMVATDSPPGAPVPELISGEAATSRSIPQDVAAQALPPETFHV